MLVTNYWHIIISEKLITTQLVKKFSAFVTTQTFKTMITKKKKNTFETSPEQV
jgi:hypothetical protein